jgi:hypothetical protein
VNLAAARIQQPQIVEDFSSGGDCGTWIAGRILLFDGNRRGEALNLVDVGLFNPLKELASISRERLNIPPLTLGIDGIEGERALPRARNAAEHRQLSMRNLAGDVFQIMCPRPADDDRVVRWNQWRSTEKKWIGSRTAPLKRVWTQTASFYYRVWPAFGAQAGQLL